MPAPGYRHVQIYTYTYINVHVHIHKYMCIHIYIYIHIYMYIHTYIYVYMKDSCPKSVPPPTDQTLTPHPLREGSLPPHTFFEIPQRQGFSRFVPSIGTCSQFCLILPNHRVAVPFPPTFASPWRNSFVQIHGGTILLKAKFGTTPQKRPKSDLNWGVGSSDGKNNPPLPNPSFPCENATNPTSHPNIADSMRHLNATNRTSPL